VIFVLMNVIAIFHSYKLTHFSDRNVEKTKSPNQLSTGQKIYTLIFGISNPRPINDNEPSTEFQTIILKGNSEIECWSIKANNPKGTVALFHGFSGQKSSMLDKATVFKELGYTRQRIDFGL